VLAALSATPQTAEQIAITAGVSDAAEMVYLLLEHLAANGRARSNGAATAGRMTFCNT
jgi:glucose-6-phosphate isomerase